MMGDKKTSQLAAILTVTVQNMRNMTSNIEQQLGPRASGKSRNKTEVETSTPTDLQNDQPADDDQLDRVFESPTENN